jgi:hypothetical protein
MSLIADIAKMKQFVAVDATMDIDTIEPYLVQAENNYLIPAIGQVTYDQLVDYMDGSSSGSLSSTALDDLLDKVYPVVCRLGLWMAVPELDLRMTDAGFVVTSNAQFAPASQYRVQNMMDNLRETGFRALDVLLIYLETNKATYTAWADSDSFTEFNEHFLRTAKEFNTYYFINNSRRLFIKLKPFIAESELVAIKNILGTDLFDALKTKVADGSTAGVYVTILDYVRRAMVYLTMQDAIPQLGVIINEQGVSINETLGSGTFIIQKSPNDNTIVSSIDQAKRKAQQMTELLAKYLEDNADDITEYTATGNTTYTVENDATLRKVYY